MRSLRQLGFTPRRTVMSTKIKSSRAKAAKQAVTTRRKSSTPKASNKTTRRKGKVVACSAEGEWSDQKEYEFHPLSKRFPLMEGPEFEDLADDIAVNGQQ